MRHTPRGRRHGRAGLGDDLLLANEVVDDDRLARLAALDARVTVAVDSERDNRCRRRPGSVRCLIDVNVGLPAAGARPTTPVVSPTRPVHGVSTVRGVMGYEGHVVGVEDRAERVEQTAVAMELLTKAHADVGGDVVSAGGTGTYDINTWANEIQAGLVRADGHGVRQARPAVPARRSRCSRP